MALVVGHRLGTKRDAHPGVVARLDGATVTEDVPTVLNRLMDALHIAMIKSLCSREGPLARIRSSCEAPPDAYVAARYRNYR